MLGKPAKGNLMFNLMMRSVDSLLQALSTSLKQPLTAFCDLDTADGDALVSNVGDYQTYIRLDGMRKMLTSADIASGASALREGVASALKVKGHAIQACFAYDPARSRPLVDRQVSGTRRIADAVGLDLADLFEERRRTWSSRMAWEESTMAFWTRTSTLTREAQKYEKAEQRKALAGAPNLRECQGIWRTRGMVAEQHRGFVDSAVAALDGIGVGVSRLTAREALASMREAIYPDTAGSGWVAHLPGRNVMPRIREQGKEGGWLERDDASGLLWDPIADQMFRDDAHGLGARQVRIGELDWTGIDMQRGPETPRAFVELLRALRRSRTPFRIAFLIEGADDSLMRFKRMAATLLAVASPANRRIHDDLERLEALRIAGQDSLVKLRVSLATWAPCGESALLRQRAASLASALGSWGVCQASVLAGDPLEAVMSSAPGLAIGSTAPVHAAILSEVLGMMPWNRPGSPWSEGSMLFSTAEGVPYHYDPTGSLRQTMFTLIFGEPGHGKSMLSNSLILALCLSAAALTSAGARLPLVGILDIGTSSKGLILLLQAALPPARRHEAVYIRYENSVEFAVNPFDTQLACRDPIPPEMAFLQNLLSLACTPIGSNKPFEGMDGLAGATLAEAYRLASDMRDNSQPKVYNPAVVPEAASALRRHRIELREDARWWDVVDALCDVGEHHLASLAQRHAVPVLADLIEAVRAPHIQHQYGKVEPGTGESLIETFQRYVTGLIEWLPNLSRPTVFETGSARVIVLDLEDVAPSGSARDDRQTEIMYVMGHHILSRNLFLRPGYVAYVPERMRAYHRKRFTEVYETIKRLVLDEIHRASASERVMDLLKRGWREGRKHRVHISMSSQMLRDFPDGLVAHATEVFILGAGNEETNIEAGERFHLSEAGRQVVRHRLKGPGSGGPEMGGGAPFLARLSLTTGLVEQLLVNTLGAREIWALSTRPQDVALRDRLYAAVGHAEAWRRLATIFPAGTALAEVERRVSELTRGGVEESRASTQVVDSLAQELLDGKGLGLALVPRLAA